MCGHATIAIGRWAVDTGRVPRGVGETKVTIQCPCGLVEARVAADGSVKFASVPAYAFALDAKVEVPGLGPITLDIGYGGAYYAFLPASRFNLDVRRSATRDLVDAADKVTRAVEGADQARSSRRCRSRLSLRHHPDRRQGCLQRRADSEYLRLRRARGGPQPDGQRRDRPHRAPACARADRAGPGAQIREHHRRHLHRQGAQHNEDRALRLR